MIFTAETNARAKFNHWLEDHPVVPFQLDEPRRPQVFNPRNRLKALTESTTAQIYVLQLPTRPAA